MRELKEAIASGLLTTTEVGKLIRPRQVTSASVTNWCNDGRLKFERRGKGPRLVTPAALREFLDREGWAVAEELRE